MKRGIEFRILPCAGLVLALALVTGADAGTLEAQPPETAPVASPTFSGEIAAIVYNQCTPCHRPDGGAPFSLVTYEDVQKRARLIAKATESGLMPPWKVTATDLRFKNERHLSGAEKEALAAWAKAGAPLGDAAAVPPPPTFSSGWSHGTPDMVLEMEEDMPIPASGTDIYRNFVVRIPELPQGKYLKGFEYKPRAIETAHHTLFSIDSTGRARQVSDAQTRPGFSGSAGGGGTSGMGRMAGWAVGSVPALFPPGASVEVPAGSDLVLSSHFHPTGKEEVERSQIALFLTDEAPTRVVNIVDVPFMFGALKNIRIPAGDPHVVVNESFTIPVDMKLGHISPHAHYLGKTMRATATLPDGKEILIVSIDDWDFAWQEQYELSEELFLPKGTRIDMEFVYDNSAENPRNPTNPPKDVQWGLQSTDEMAAITLGLITETQEQRDALRSGYVAWIKQDIEKADPRIALASLSTMASDRFDLDGDGDVTWTETWVMGRQIYDRISSRGSDRARTGGLADARSEIMPLILRRVLRLVLLPWLLPRVAVALLVIVALVYLLRRWRKRRRARALVAATAEA